MRAVHTIMNCPRMNSMRYLRNPFLRLLFHNELSCTMIFHPGSHSSSARGTDYNTRSRGIDAGRSERCRRSVGLITVDQKQLLC